DEELVFNVESTSKYPPKHGDESIHKIDILDITCEDHFNEVLNVQKLINPISGSPTPSPDPMVDSLSPSLTPFGDSDFLLEETDAFLSLDDSIPSGIDNGIYDLEGLKVGGKRTASEEVIKLLDAGLIYPISDNPWVSPIHVVPKKGGIVLGHKISKSGIEVNRAKVDVIAKLPYLTTVKGIRSFLGHVGFYRRFIKDFSKIARPMTCLLEKDTPFFFSNECLTSFKILKKKLTKAPILVSPDWDLPFELMCDASDFVVGAVLGQRKDKYFRPIHYAMYADHSALKYLFAKQDAKPRLLWWILLLQEFNIEIRDKKGAENLAAGHLSRLENPHQGDLVGLEMNDNFPHESLNMISLNLDNEPPWFADITNYLVGNICADPIIRRCVDMKEAMDIL
ncbi:reverse transcriptase domain-containing protein, partial [Tanacetum coccineum]